MGFKWLSFKYDAVCTVRFNVLVNITEFYGFGNILGSANILVIVYANFQPFSDRSGLPPIRYSVLYVDSPCLEI
jgi:hypothetical protein